MDKNDFWAVVEKCRNAHQTDHQAFLDELMAALQSQTPEEVVQFKLILDAYAHLADKPGLWSAAIAMNDMYCSDDSFFYFRGWLISQGKKAYLAALEDPDSLADVDCPPCELESVYYIPSYAYEKLTGGADIYELLPRGQDEMLLSALRVDIQYGKGIDIKRSGGSIPNYIPRLCKKLLNGRDMRDWPLWL